MFSGETKSESGEVLTGNSLVPFLGPGLCKHTHITFNVVSLHSRHGQEIWKSCH